MSKKTKVVLLRKVVSYEFVAVSDSIVDVAKYLIEEEGLIYRKDALADKLRVGMHLGTDIEQKWKIVRQEDYTTGFKEFLEEQEQEEME